MLHLPFVGDQIRDQRREAGRRYREALTARSLELPNAAAQTEQAKSERDRLLADEVAVWTDLVTKAQESNDQDFEDLGRDRIRTAYEAEEEVGG